MNFRELPDDTLIGLAEDPNRRNGAVVEMMRRLKEAIKKFDQASRRYSKWLIGLTCMLTILTVVLTWLTFLLINKSQ